MSIIVVQQICTKWTKVSRGGENAGKRSAVPEVVRVPVERIKAVSPILVHQSLFFHESNGFCQPREEVAVDPNVRPLVVGCVSIAHADETVTAIFRYDRRCGGAPERGWARKTFVLAPNEWAQIIYNGRFVWEEGWWYQKMVVNVGLFERPTPSVFTKNEPTYRFAAMGKLF